MDARTKSGHMKIDHGEHSEPGSAWPLGIVSPSRRGTHQPLGQRAQPSPGSSSMAVAGILSNAKNSLRDLNLYSKKSTNVRPTAAKIQFANKLDSDATDLGYMANKMYQTEEVHQHAK